MQSLFILVFVALDHKTFGLASDFDIFTLFTSHDTTLKHTLTYFRSHALHKIQIFLHLTWFFACYSWLTPHAVQNTS